jgi:hypothetical protein
MAMRSRFAPEPFPFLSACAAFFAMAYLFR